MHDDRILLETRLQRLIDLRIAPAVRTTTDLPVQIGAWVAPGEPVAADAAIAADYTPFTVGERWGRAWGTTWFRFSGTVPSQYADACVELEIDLGFLSGPGFTCEGLVWTPEGQAVSGLHPCQRRVPLGVGAFCFYVEAASNPTFDTGDTRPTGLGDWASAGDRLLYQLVSVDVVVRHVEVEELLRDLEVLRDTMHALPVEDPRRAEILRGVDRGVDVLDMADLPGTASAARHLIAPLFEAPPRASAHHLSAVGHAHIDSAWLWPIRETKRKVARTLSNVLRLAENEPDLVFAFSAAQHHAWLRDDYPGVFARLRQAVADGVVAPVGGMWVEADAVLTGGESMVRQFVYGKEFFLREYGIDTDEAWLPDSFGYAGGLPQIVALSGSSSFLTQKMSWNRTNAFPHHTFWWEGIDGTRLLMHFPPADTYNAEARADVHHAAVTCRDKAVVNASVLPLGYGDGGGGPTREMVARSHRYHLEGAPVVRFEHPQAFFDRARSALTSAEDAPVWSGELYLEMHRGTLTSQAHTKQGNRRCEHLLREAEIWWTAAMVAGLGEYPYEALDRLWTQVLLLQFHDILPGSSIRWVHREAETTYADLIAELESLVKCAQTALAGEGDRPVTFNATVTARDGVPALGAGLAQQTAQHTVTEEVPGGWRLDNGLVTVMVDRRGIVTSVLDRLADGRDVLAGPSNLLQLHPDVPSQYDAWDLDHWYRRRSTVIDEVTGVEVGDGCLTVSRRHGDSAFVQRIGLAAGSRRVDFTTEVDWRERESVLKAGFCLDVQADRCAAETQFGHVWRPIHTNTSWDAARFEVCAHRYLYLHEEGYGVALVNDSTYGHDVRREVVGEDVATSARLTLLRAPRFPDPEADQGRHVMRYALVVGADVSTAVAEGVAINLPQRTVTGGRDVVPLVTPDRGDVVVSSVTAARDRSGDVVVRVHQATGGRAETRLRLGFTAATVTVCDLLERPITEESRAVLRRRRHPEVCLESGTTVVLHLRAFEVVTLRLAVSADPSD